MYTAASQGNHPHYDPQEATEDLRMDAADELLAIDADGSAINKDALARWRLRFDPRTGSWMRVSLRKVGMPRRVSRSTILEETGANEEVLKAWEAAMRTATASEEDAVQLLRLTPDGKPEKRDALAKWRFQFFPQAGRWRRATAARDEVTSEAVAKKVGVSVEVLKAWEVAMISLAEADKRA